MTLTTGLAVQNSVASASLLAFCKASADGSRLDILRVLREESFGVLELCRIFQMPQPGMSHHLKVLAGANLVETRKEGNSVFYRRSIIFSGHPLSTLYESLFDTVDRVPLAEGVAVRMGEVHAARAQRSHQFFEKHAGELKHNQQQIARFDQYVESVDNLLDNLELPDAATVLEIGPGASEMINLLARRFRRVIALDNSAEMLARARDTLDHAYAGRVQFIEGEAEEITGQTAALNLIVLNMVLHHLPSPARMFRTAHKRLQPGGCLLVIDLGPHDQDWARHTCGDLWLGFDPLDLDDWAADAGLDKGQSVYIGLKNGFQVQIRLFNLPPHQPTRLD